MEVLNEAKQDQIYFLNYLFSFLGLIIVIYFQVKLQNKSEQKILEQEAKPKESEERFRLAVEGTNTGIWYWMNINDDEQWWPPKLFELLGYKTAEIAPSQGSFKNLLAQKMDYPTLVSDFRRRLFHKEPFSIEYKLEYKDGSKRWFNTSGQAKWTKGEQPLRMVESLVDITEKKVKEEEIKEQNSLL